MYLLCYLHNVINIHVKRTQTEFMCFYRTPYYYFQTKCIFVSFN